MQNILQFTIDGIENFWRWDQIFTFYENMGKDLNSLGTLKCEVV